VTSAPDATSARNPPRRVPPLPSLGTLGYASAGAIADFIIVDMVAEAASGDKTPKQAAERAALRAQRYYKV
jgi:multiple sugar transport system substrate-binding protein